MQVLGNTPTEQQNADNEVCSCEKDGDAENRARQSKSHDPSPSHSRSSENSDRDSAIEDRRSNRDQD